MKSTGLQLVLADIRKVFGSDCLSRERWHIRSSNAFADERTVIARLYQCLWTVLRQRINYLMMRDSPDERDDVTSDAMIKSFPAIPKLVEHENPDAYVRLIAYSTWVDWLRKQGRQPPTEPLDEDK